MAFGLPANSASIKLVDELVKLGKLDQTYANALKTRFKTTAGIAQFLLANAKVTEEDLVKATSVVLDLPFVHLVGKAIDHSILTIIPEQVARDFHAIAYLMEGKTLKVAVGRPYNLIPSVKGPLHELELQKDIKIELSVTTMRDISWALTAYTVTPDLEPDKSNARDTPRAARAIPDIDLSKQAIPHDALVKFPQEIAEKYHMVVFDNPAKDHLKVAVIDPLDTKIKEMIDFIEKKNNISIELYKTSMDSLRAALSLYDKKPEHPKEPLEEQKQSLEPQKVVS